MPALSRGKQEDHELKSSVPGTHMKKLDMVVQAWGSCSGNGGRRIAVLAGQLSLCGEFQANERLPQNKANQNKTKPQNKSGGQV